MNKLTYRILAAMVLGVIAGLLLHPFHELPAVETYVTGGILHIVGRMFIAALTMLVVPVVFVSLVCGISAIGDMGKLGRVGAKTILFYMGTTVIALSLALASAIAVSPGKGFELEGTVDYVPPQAPPISEVIAELVPRNVIDAFAQGNTLQIIVFAILFGMAMSLSGAPGRRILAIFQDLMEIIMKLIMMIMWVAPIGVFALLTRVFATVGYDGFGPLATYLLLVLVVLMFHGFVVYPILLKLLSGLPVLPFFKHVWPAQVFAFSTASSAATLPITLRIVEKKMGVDNSVAAFAIPLGATINMNGTAIFQGIAAVFIAQAYGISLGMGDYLTIVLTATLAAIGTAGVPGAGTIILAMVLTQVGIPLEGIAIILGVDRIVDMLRTAMNVTGDAVASCIVAKSEGALNREVFDGKVSVEDEVEKT